MHRLDPTPAEPADALRLIEAARYLSGLAGQHDLAGRSDRRAEVLAWRASALRAAAEELETAEAWRHARSAARIARVAALDAAELRGVTGLNRQALARATGELGLCTLRLGAMEADPAGSALRSEALQCLDEAAALWADAGNSGEAQLAAGAAAAARVMLRRS